MIEIIKTIIPLKIRKIVGNIIDRHPIIFLPLLWIIYRMIILPCPIRFNTFLIITSQGKIFVKVRGWSIFQEIFREKIYEKMYNIKKDDVVIDVGANVGIFALKAVRCVGNKGLVITIEPEPNNFELLRKNLKNYQNVIILQEAVGNYCGEAKLYLSENSEEHSIKRDFGGGYVVVKIETLDSIITRLNLKKVNFVKIDVEGAEIDVLERAKKVLSTYKPVLAIEYHGNKNMNKIIKILKDFSYNFKIMCLDNINSLGIIYAWYGGKYYE